MGKEIRLLLDRTALFLGGLTAGSPPQVPFHQGQAIPATPPRQGGNLPTPENPREARSNGTAVSFKPEHRLEAEGGILAFDSRATRLGIKIKLSHHYSFATSWLARTRSLSNQCNYSVIIIGNINIYVISFIAVIRIRVI